MNVNRNSDIPGLKEEYEKWKKQAQKFYSEVKKGKKTAKLGSSRDYFQDYKGENYVILNDLRPNEFSYADLLRLTDPYQHDKAAPRRYHDLKLNLKTLIITSPYSPEDFYEYCKVDNYQIDTFEQLKRRLHVIHVTDELMKQVMPDEFGEDDLSDLIGFWDRGVLMSKKEVPIWHKTNLTLEEAAAYSNIGLHKLREITDDEDCNFVLWIGNKRLIKREPFDKYLSNAYSL